MTDLKQNIYTLFVLGALIATAWTASTKEMRTQSQLIDASPITNQSETLLMASRR